MIAAFFTIAVLCALIAPLLPLSDQIVAFHGSLFEANAYVVCCFFCFLFPYASLKHWARPLRHTLATNKASVGSIVRTRYAACMAIFSLTGLYVSILQVSKAMGLAAYLDAINKGGSATQYARGATILVDSSVAGLPGFIKVFNQNCELSMLLVLYWMAERRRFTGLKTKACIAIIVITFALHNFLYIDRLSLLALVPPVYSIWQQGTKRTRRYLATVALFVLILAEVQSQRRGYSSLNFFVLYVQSGMINTAETMQTFAGPPTYGFQTFLAPVYWVFKSYGHRLFQSLHFFWIWNPAQNLYGSLYMDFGWFGPVLFVPVALICSKLDMSTGKANKVISRSRVRSFVSFAAASTMFVPAFQGPEFWLTLLMLGVITRIESRYVSFCFAKPKPKLIRRSTRPSRLSYSIPWDGVLHGSVEDLSQAKAVLTDSAV